MCLPDGDGARILCVYAYTGPQRSPLWTYSLKTPRSTQSKGLTRLTAQAFQDLEIGSHWNRLPDEAGKLFLLRNSEVDHLPKDFSKHFRADLADPIHILQEDSPVAGDWLSA